MTIETSDVERRLQFVEVNGGRRAAFAEGHPQPAMISSMASGASPITRPRFGYLQSGAAAHPVQLNRGGRRRDGGYGDGNYDMGAGVW